MSDKTVVLTENAPAPAHLFCQGVQKGGIFQVSGQAPWIQPVISTSDAMTYASRPGKPSKTSKPSWKPADPLSMTC
jgi:enamine deaminase RidA (YjgF/YER057c/UK114 family)